MAKNLAWIEIITVLMTLIWMGAMLGFAMLLFYLSVKQYVDIIG